MRTKKSPSRHSLMTEVISRKTGQNSKTDRSRVAILENLRCQRFFPGSLDRRRTGGEVVVCPVSQTTSICTVTPLRRGPSEHSLPTNWRGGINWKRTSFAVAFAAHRSVDSLSQCLCFVPPVESTRKPVTESILVGFDRLLESFVFSHRPVSQ